MSDIQLIRTVTGTLNKIDISYAPADTFNNKPIFTISPNFPGTITALGVVTQGTWNASYISPSYGGTGLGGLAGVTQDAFLIGNGVNPFQTVTLNSGQVLIGTGGLPQSASLTPGAGINITSGSGSITIAQIAPTPTPGSPLGTDSGGTGVSSPAAGAIISHGTTLPFTSVALSSGQFLAADAAGIAAGSFIGGTGISVVHDALITNSFTFNTSAIMVLLPTGGAALTPLNMDPNVGMFVPDLYNTVPNAGQYAFNYDLSRLTGYVLGKIVNRTLQPPIPPFPPLTPPIGFHSTWEADVIEGEFGGTGHANTGKTITIGGNVTTEGSVTFSGGGNPYTFTGNLTANTSVTFPTSGTLLSVIGGVLPPLQGGTGHANNNLYTITLGGAVSTGGGLFFASGASFNGTVATAGALTLSGAYAINGGFAFTGTLTGTTTVTFPTAGLLLSDNAVVTPMQGGTGWPNNNSYTMILGGSVQTGGNLVFDGGFTMSGASPFIGNLTASTNVTFPTSGVLFSTASLILPANGGTGVANANARTITLGGAINTGGAFTTGGGVLFTAGASFGGSVVTAGTVSIAGNFSMTGASPFIGNLTASTNVTFPTSGTLISDGVGSLLLPINGGTGVANANTKTITLGGPVNIAAPQFNIVGANNLTITTTNSTSVTLPTTGVLLSDTSLVLPVNGGTGVANANTKTITLGGPVSTSGNFTMAGGFAFTGTVTAGTSVIFPTSGTLLGMNTSDYTTALTNGRFVAGSGTGPTTGPVVGAFTSLGATLDLTNSAGVSPIGRNFNFDISATYPGQASIVTLGTIATGIWHGTVIAGQYGGTGVANTGKTITIGGNVTTDQAVTFASTGGPFTFTGRMTATTDVTFPASGTIFSTASTVPVANGGTGDVSFSIGSLLVGNNTASINEILLDRLQVPVGIYTGGGTGSPVNTTIAGRNLLINATFHIAQRAAAGTVTVGGAAGGSSFAIPNTAASYTLDQWQVNNNGGTAGAYTVYQVPYGATGYNSSNFNANNGPPAPCAFRLQRNNGSAATNAVSFAQTVTKNQTFPVVGMKTCLGFFALRGQNQSFTSLTVQVLAYGGVGSNISVYNGAWGGSQQVLLNTTVTPPTFNGTTTNPTFYGFEINTLSALGAAQIAVLFSVTFAGGAAGLNDWIQISHPQLEVNNYMTPLDMKSFSQTYEECVRFYFKSFAYNTLPAAAVGTSTGEELFTSNGASSIGTRTVAFPAPMRSDVVFTLDTSGTVSTGNKIYTFNPTATGAAGSLVNKGGAYASANSATGVPTTMFSNSRGFALQMNPATTASADILGVHWVADASPY